MLCLSQSAKSPDILSLDLTNAFKDNEVTAISVQLVALKWGMVFFAYLDLTKFGERRAEVPDSLIRWNHGNSWDTLVVLLWGGPDFGDHNGDWWFLCRRPSWELLLQQMFMTFWRCRNGRSRFLDDTWHEHWHVSGATAGPWEAHLHKHFWSAKIQPDH